MNIKSCPMCGGELSSEGICLQCGNAVSSGVTTIINQPNWGKLTIDLSLLKINEESVINDIKNIWSRLEIETSQKLFSPQEVSGIRMELVGAEESFYILKNALEAKYQILGDWIRFDLLSHDDVYRLRKDRLGF